LLFLATCILFWEGTNYFDNANDTL